MDRNKITVVLCCYNHGCYLINQLKAITSQLAYIHSVILLDDGSTDDTYKIMSEYSKSSDKFRIIKNDTNQGLVAAVNAACEYICSEYVYFASADDLILPAFFEDYNRAINKYPGCGYYFGDYAESLDCESVQKRIKLLKFKDIIFLSPISYAIEIQRGFRNAPGQTVVFNANELRDIGFFDSELGGWLDLYPQYVLGFRKGVVYLPGIYCIARKSENSWGEINSRNVDLLRNAGRTFTAKLIQYPELAIFIKKSGILALALDSYKILFKYNEMIRFVGFGKVLLMLQRELWYMLPAIVRRKLSFCVSKR